MNNTRFAVGVHILSLLSCHGEDYVSSELIAKSINMNPAMVRKELGVLRQTGLIESKEGIGGGSRLARKPEHISFDEVYLAVKEDSHVLGLYREDPNQQCPVGAKINQALEGLFQEVETAFLLKLRMMSLAEFTKVFR